MTEKIYAAIILQIMGRPKDHLQKASEELIEALGKEKGVRITSKVLHELKVVENKDEQGKVIEVSEELKMYSTYAEIEVEVNDIMTLTAICFKYMPSHIEIIEPDNFAINNYEVSAILGELVAKLHNYDAIAKTAIMQNQMLAQKFKELQEAGVPGIEMKDDSEKQDNKKSEKKK